MSLVTILSDQIYPPQLNLLRTRRQIKLLLPRNTSSHSYLTTTTTTTNEIRVIVDDVRWWEWWGRGHACAVVGVVGICQRSWGHVPRRLLVEDEDDVGESWRP